MLEIKKTAIALDEAELMELERIITDNEEQSALRLAYHKRAAKAE